MRSILSVILAAALLLGTLTACAGNRLGKVEEARATPTARPAATARPDAADSPDSAVDDAGDAIGNAAENAGNAVGDVVSGAGEAVNDLVGDGRVTDDDGLIDDTPDATAVPGRGR